MKSRVFLLLEILIVAAVAVPAYHAFQSGNAQDDTASAKWEELPEIPPAPRGGGPVRIDSDQVGKVSGVVESEDEDEDDGGNDRALDLAVDAWGQPGLAGPFVGISGGALVVGGGANFPEAMPWDGGAKVWQNQVYVLPADDAERWMARKGWWLPRPLAYGVSISTRDGIIGIGGCDAEQCYRDVFRIAWDPEERMFSTVELAPMPVPLAFAAGAQVGDTVFVVGGQRAMQDAAATNDFLAYDIAADSWRERSPFPGPARVLPLVAAQSDGAEECLYVISGRNVGPGQATALLSDTWKYSPSANTWTEIAPVSADGGETRRCVMAGTCVASGTSGITVFGGADGKLLLELERLGKLASGDSAEANAAREKSRSILTSHPGFSRDILSYNTVADQWAKVGELPHGSQVTTTAMPWNGGVVIPSGEIQPGVRTSKVWSLRAAE